MKCDWRKEFPRFPDMYEVATLANMGFEDTSWHNNACPSFVSPDKAVWVWIEHPDPRLREMPQRFCVEQIEYVDGEYKFGEDSKVYLTTESWTDVVEWLDQHFDVGVNDDKTWYFVHNGMCISNPTASECGRFLLKPSEYGFNEISTGGGCTAWYRQLNSKYYMMITDDGGASAEYEDVITVGIYEVESGDQVCSYCMDVGDNEIKPDTYYNPKELS